MGATASHLSRPGQGRPSGTGEAKEVTAAETLAVAQAQIGRQGVDEGLAVLGAHLAGLLDLDDMAAPLPSPPES